MFLGFNTATKVECAVKTAQKNFMEAKRQIRNETKTLAMLNQDGIVKYLHYSELKKQAFLFLEHCPGKTLL